MPRELETNHQKIHDFSVTIKKNDMELHPNCPILGTVISQV